MPVNAKMISIETVPGIGGLGNKEKWWKGAFKCGIVNTL
jgi:hypothetical protein